MAVTRKVVRVDINDLAQKFAVAAKGYLRGDKFDVEKFAKDHNVTTDIITKHVYNRALIKHGVEPLELVLTSAVHGDTVFVNERGLMVIGKTKHGFPNGTKFTVTRNDDGLVLSMSA